MQEEVLIREEIKEMLRKNSHYGSVDIIVNEAVAVFYASERKRGFR